MTGQHGRSDTALQLLAALLVAMFVCGGLFFAYQIYETVREAVLTLGLPDIGDLPVLSVGAQPARSTAPNIAAGERVNVLVMGVDRRPSEKCPCRSDVMMIASLDPKTMTAGLVTIPRDLYVPIPGVTEDRINTALFYGDLNKYPGGGPALAMKTVEYNLGVRIHYYVIIDFGGFRKVVDTLGGIDVYVPKAIDDPTYPDENFGVKPIHIPAGWQHMDGETALEYARSRHGDNDFERSRRQVQILMAIRDKALRLDLLPKLPALLSSMSGTVQTDMQPQEVIALAAAASKVKTDSIKTATIDQTMTVEFRASTGADVLWPDRAKIGQLMQQIIPTNNASTNQTAQIAQEAARVLVLNGTSDTTASERTAKYLQSQGFLVTAYGNADRFDYTKTVLIDYSGKKDSTVTALSNLFNVDPENIRQSTNVKSDDDLTIILGSDWTPPPTP
ncbi:MAG: LCP family protein [Chloroflexi bacterium]|nr:LCP family protein [Chloroflexota bacterium]